MRADVLIVGSGAAGATAAIEAATRGADVLILEALPIFGGAAAASGGGTCIAGSPLQQHLGLADSPSLALEDWLTLGGAEADRDWAACYLEASTSELFTWLAELGVEWTHVMQQEGNRAPRWHAPRGNGAGLMRAVESHLRGLPVRTECDARVIDLVSEGGRVRGVIAESFDGTQSEHRADAVLIASGGFLNNAEMTLKFTADAVRGSRVLLGGGQGAVGGGHRVLENVGATFTHMDLVWMYPYGTPDPADPAGLKGLVLRGMDGDIW